MGLKGIYAFKVQNGKLVCAEVEFSRTLKKVKITGDFFLHPEDAIISIEKFLQDLDADFQEKETADSLSQILSEQGAQLIGASPADIVAAVKGAVGCAVGK